MRSIFFAPHADDETLFGAFTLLKYQPTVVICHPSLGDYGSTEERFQESVAACLILGISDVRQWVGGDLADNMKAIDAEIQPEFVWVPSVPRYGSAHPEHTAVHLAAYKALPRRGICEYDTYGIHPWGVEKQREKGPIPIEQSRWIADKHFALTKYQSQIAHPRSAQFFTWDLAEFGQWAL